MPKLIYTYFAAGRMWFEAGLKKAQVQYLSAELFRISQQRDNMRNSKAKAKQLIDHKNNHAK